MESEEFMEFEDSVVTFITSAFTSFTTFVNSSTL